MDIVDELDKMYHDLADMANEAADLKSRLITLVWDTAEETYKAGKAEADKCTCSDPTILEKSYCTKCKRDM